MRIDLPYGSSIVPVDVPDGVRVEGLEWPPPVEDLGAGFLDAVGNPVGARPLRESVPERGRITILIADTTRSGATAGILGHLIEALGSWGAGPDRIEIIVAAGMHGGQDSESIEKALGSETTRGCKILVHDARDRSSMISTGRTPSGTECLFNSRVVGSSLVIALGLVSFHYFAGFGGSRKLILPGVASEQTIISNHRLSLQKDPGNGLHPACRPGNLEGNPVHIDMLEGVKTLGRPVFVINAVKGSGDSISFLNAGDVEDSHAAAAAWMKDHYTFCIESRYRAVIASAGGAPSDIDLLQSHKAIRYAASALEEGGLMLLSAECAGGSGSPSLEKAFGRGRDKVPEVVRSRYELNSQTAMSMYDLTSRFSIYLRSRLPGGLTAGFGMAEWKDGFEGYLLEGIGAEEILVIMDAARFLPFQRPEPGDDG